MYFNIDMALSRTFPVGCEKRLEFRFEAFNVLNRFQAGEPVVNFNSADFGRIITAAGSAHPAARGKFLF